MMDRDEILKAFGKIIADFNELQKQTDFDFVAVSSDCVQVRPELFNKLVICHKITVTKGAERIFLSAVVDDVKIDTVV